MSFQCPQSSNIKSLAFINTIELSPDARSDEISLLVLHCRDCWYERLDVDENISRGRLGYVSVLKKMPHLE